MKTNYTKGEWYAVNIAGRYIIQDEDSYNGTVLFDEFECEEAEYNAKLAAAAPDLFSCLNEMTNYIQGMDSSNRVVLRIPIELSQKIGETIRKATE